MFALLLMALVFFSDLIASLSATVTTLLVCIYYTYYVITNDFCAIIVSASYCVEPNFIYLTHFLFPFRRK